MPDIRRAKHDAWADFFASCLFGLLPVLAHALVALAERAGMLPIQQPIPFAQQNWVGHMVFFALAVGSGAFLNVMKMDRQWSPGLKVGFASLLGGTVILWLLFGIMAVGGAPSVSGGAVILLGIAGVTAIAYYVETTTAVLRAGHAG